MDGIEIPGGSTFFEALAKLHPAVVVTFFVLGVVAWQLLKMVKLLQEEKNKLSDARVSDSLAMHDALREAEKAMLTTSIQLQSQQQAFERLRDQIIRGNNDGG